MRLGDEIADLLTHRATVLRALDVVPSATGVTRRDFLPLAAGVPCRLSALTGASPQGEAGLRVVAGCRALFLLGAPVQVQDRLHVEGVTYLAAFVRLVHDDLGPSHLLVECERIAVGPLLDTAVLATAWLPLEVV